MEVKNKRYIHEIFFNMSNRSKVLAILGYYIFGCLFSYFVLLAPYYEKQEEVYAEFYDNICKIVNEVQKDGLNSTFDNIPGKVEFLKYEVADLGIRSYSYSYSNVHYDGKVYSIQIRITIEKDGTLSHSMPNISSKEECSYQARRIRFGYSICLLAIVLFIIPLVILIVSINHDILDKKLGRK